MEKLTFPKVMVLVAVLCCASAAEARYALPSSRSVTWTGNVGVSGDIPERTAICATLSPSGADDTAAIRSALRGCAQGGVVKLAPGTFKVSGAIDVPSHRTLRGSGMGATVIQGQREIPGDHLLGTSGITWDLSNARAINLVSAEKGSTTITTSSPHGWGVGSYLLIDQLNAGTSADPPVTNVGAGGSCTWCSRENGNRVMGQLAKVTAVPSRTSATLEIPLYATYQPRLSAQAVEIKYMPEGAGIEDLTVDNASSNAGSAIYHVGGADCWVLNVEIIGSNVAAYRGYYTYRTTVRGCKMHEGVPATPTNGSQYGPGHGYGIWLSMGGSANLVENNHLYHLSAPLLADGAISGNVWSYNVIHHLYYVDNAWNREAVSLHGAYPFMNLFEGNYSTDWIIADNYWGNSGHNTFFRNRHHSDRGKSSAQWNVVIGANSWYWNMVGNVWGTSRHETIYQINACSGFSNTEGPKAVYGLGCSNSVNGGTWDRGVAKTLLRHGNWDSVTNGVVWNGSDDRDLPPSLYLTSKPAWWGSAPWPLIGPDLSPMYPKMSRSWMPPWGGWHRHREEGDKKRKGEEADSPDSHLDKALK